MSNTNRRTLRRVKFYDWLARWVVTFGGLVVIVCVLAILVSIVATTLPLFYAAHPRVLAEADLPAAVKPEGVLALGIQAAADDSWLIAHVVDGTGKFRFVDLRKQELIDEADAAPPAADVEKPQPGKPRSRMPPRTLLGATPSGESDFTLRWSDGVVSLVHVAAKTELAGEVLKVPKLSVETVAAIPADKTGVPEQAVMYRTGEDSARCAALYNGRKIVVTRQIEDTSGDKTETKIILDPEVPGPVTAIAMSGDGKWLYAGTAGGALLWWKLDDERVADRDVVPPSREKSPITTLKLMLGDITLVAGDADGNTTNWFFVRSESDQPKTAAGDRGMVKEARKLTYIRALALHRAAIDDIAPSPRNREVLIGDRDGLTSLDYTTSQSRLLSFGGVTRAAFGGRGDTVAGLAGHRIKAWRVEGSLWGIFTDKLHPEAGWDSFCGRIWYEGHNAPDFFWQPQGGVESEPKLSIVPLVFGTLKGTFYAMLLAGPLALGAAAYVSHFTSPRVRAWIKPAIEMMAAVPSVVLGFLVGLWLAPLLSDWLLAFFLALVTVPLAFLIFLWIWQAVRKSPAAEKLVRGWEFFLTALWIVVGLAAAALLSGPMEQHLFGGDVAQWMAVRLGMVYDQRNSILIAFGVGFMVVPMIFSLSEDALSSVPYDMTAASLALGASRWQTLWRVILPSASPGIFAAVMIGFGRAVGETMVFLMATGNTPIIDLSPFNGMRTLSATIAEEQPGAPVNGTLYRTLFLCAVILFVITFFLNTCAEFVRQRLRNRYGKF